MKGLIYLYQFVWWNQIFSVSLTTDAAELAGHTPFSSLVPSVSFGHIGEEAEGSGNQNVKTRQFAKKMQQFEATLAW